MSSLARRVGRSAVLYGAATVIARIASVALLPVYTRYLAPADYGLLQLLELAAEVTSILFVAGSRAGMMRFYYRTENSLERRQVVSTAFFLESFLAIIATLALVAAAHPVWRAMLAGEGSTGLVRLAALNFLLGTLQNTPLTYLQTQQRAAAYTVLLTSKLVLQITFNLYFLVQLDMGVQGMLLSGIVVNALVSIVTVTWMLRETGTGLSWPLLRDLRRYGVPYQVASSGGFVLTFGDRFFLQRFHGATQVGLYALAYQFGFLLTQLGAGPFLRAWLPERHKGHALPQAERDRETRQGFLFFNLLLLAMATGIALLARPAVHLLADPSYQGSAALVPLIVAAYIPQAWTEAVKFGIDVAERTIFYTYSSLAATAVVLVAYALLIPPFGAMGAALATLIALLVRFWLTLRWAQQLHPLDYGWFRTIQMLGLGVLAVLTSMAVHPSKLIYDLLLSGILGTGYAAGVWAIVLHPSERAEIVRWVRVRLRRTA